MRPFLIFAAPVLLAAALAAGCSRDNRSNVGSDVRDAGRSIRQEASKVAHDPDVRQAEADLKGAGHDAAHDLRNVAGDAKVGAHQLASDTRSAAHDVARSGDDRRRDR